MPRLSTAFASPERATPETVRRQSLHFHEALLFRQLLDRVPDMVMILNAERQVVYANHAVVEAAMEHDLAAILGKRPGEVFGCKHSDETPGGCGTTRFCRYCGAARAILQGQKGEFSVEECRMITTTDKGEQALDLRVWASPMRIEQESFTFCVVADIADEKRRFWLERVFLHDLTNSAVALQAFLGLLDKEPGKDQDELFGYIGSLSKRIVDEIESHRQIVAAENNELQVSVAKIDPRKVVAEVFTAYNNPRILNGRCMRVDSFGRVPDIESDRTLLVRVLGNMVKNAIEGSVPGEEVTMGCRRCGDAVQFWVHNPTYIPENVRLQIFNRSFSTKGAGRGLGSYSMKLLTEHYLGGKIAFTSSESKGTTFFASYPIHPQLSLSAVA